LEAVGFSSASEYAAVIKAHKNNPVVSDHHRTGALLRVVLSHGLPKFKSELDLN
jgi:hypothetical protein